jgi:hypothetical protein
LGTPPKCTERPSKSTVLALFTEKPLKALKNSSGLRKEIKISKVFHQKGIPVLVSPLLLRQRSLGQVDLVRLTKIHQAWRLEVLEVKMSPPQEVFKKKNQFSRLQKSAHFLAQLFKAEVSLKIE